MIQLEFKSSLRANRAEVWDVVSTMDGVNNELHPLLRMSVTPGYEQLPTTVRPGQAVFTSWLLLAGVVPFDRHALALESIDAGHGFVEESTSWFQRRWRHERSLTSTENGGCEVVDRLVIEPRVGLTRPIVRVAVRRLFRHRHRRLRRRFGTGVTRESRHRVRRRARHTGV